MDNDYIAQLQHRLEHFQRLERLQNRKAEIAIGLLRELYRNPNLLSGRRRIRVLLKKRWDMLNHKERTGLE